MTLPFAPILPEKLLAHQGAYVINRVLASMEDTKPDPELSSLAASKSRMLLLSSEEEGSTSKGIKQGKQCREIAGRKEEHKGHQEKAGRAGSGLPRALGGMNCPSSPAAFIPPWVFINVPGAAVSPQVCQRPYT